MKFRIILTSMAFVAALTSAFTTKSSRNLYTKVSTGSCALILCAKTDVDGTAIACPDQNQKYSTSTCTNHPFNPAGFTVINN